MNVTEDYSENTVLISKGKSFQGRELKSSTEPTFSFTCQATVSDSDGVRAIDMCDNKVMFYQNLQYWNDQVMFMSVNNYDNSYFEKIVEMGKDAVPFIIDELRKGPTPLVYALDKIFPGTVEYDGFVSLKDACDTWISILD